LWTVAAAPAARALDEAEHLAPLLVNPVPEVADVVVALGLRSAMRALATSWRVCAAGDGVHVHVERHFAPWIAESDQPDRKTAGSLAGSGALPILLCANA
jgi:hypothetical protein